MHFHPNQCQVLRMSRGRKKWEDQDQLLGHPPTCTKYLVSHTSKYLVSHTSKYLVSHTTVKPVLGYTLTMSIVITKVNRSGLAANKS